MPETMIAGFVLCAVLLLVDPAAARADNDLKDLVVGQRLTFLTCWNGIPVGKVATTVEGITRIQSREAYKVTLRAKTNRWASLIYNVNDKYVTYIDRETSCSLRHEVYRSEGNYRKKAVIDYIYGRLLAQYHYLKDGRKKSVEVAETVHDPLSAAYYFLRRDLAVGDQEILNIDLNEKKHRLAVKIEKGRKIRLQRLGTFDSLTVRPYLERKGKPYKKGNGLGYISADGKRLPLFAVLSVFPWGRFSVTLLSCSL